MAQSDQAESTAALGALAELAYGKLSELNQKFPELDAVVVARLPNGLVATLAGCNLAKQNEYDRMNNVLRLLRSAAHQIGQQLFRSPGDPQEVHAESVRIREMSRGMADRYVELANKSGHDESCGCSKCRVTVAATFVAAGVRLLSSLGMAEEPLVDLTRMAKEACRRAHLRVLESSARGQA